MHHVDLSKIVLSSGSHPDDPEQGCVMEWVSVFAGERTPTTKTDRPKCTSPVIAAFAITWNDALDDTERQRLVPFIPKLVGTTRNAVDERVRGWMATDWLVRTFAPAWLRLAKMDEHAVALEDLPELTSGALARAAQPIIEVAYSAADSAAYSAADSVADSATDSATDSVADSATDSVADSAARSVAYSAAYSAAYAAARSAARSAAYSAARSAAYAAAHSAAHSAAYSAARSAARSAAHSAAYSAAYESLAPTVKLLQDSAEALLDRMIAVGKS